MYSTVLNVIWNPFLELKPKLTEWLSQWKALLHHHHHQHRPHHHYLYLSLHPYRNRVQGLRVCVHWHERMAEKPGEEEAKTTASKKKTIKIGNADTVLLYLDYVTNDNLFIIANRKIGRDFTIPVFRCGVAVLALCVCIWIFNRTASFVMFILAPLFYSFAGFIRFLL